MATQNTRWNWQRSRMSHARASLCRLWQEVQVELHCLGMPAGAIRFVVAQERFNGNRFGFRSFVIIPFYQSGHIYLEILFLHISFSIFGVILIKY